MELSKIYHRLYDEWNIGFMKVDDGMLDAKVPDVKWMRHNYKDRWFADPQILSVDDGIIKVLVEELVFARDIGQIALLGVDAATLELVSRKDILSLPTHLSFPQVLREGDKVFIYPENGGSGELWLYEYDTEKDQLTGEKRLLADMALADATILPFDTKRMLATSAAPNGNVLDILCWDDVAGKYKICDSYTFKENVARNAGPCFALGERWIRPAQVSNHSYGEALELQEVVVDDDGGMRFDALCRWHSPHPTHTLSFHNFCVHDGIAAVDCRGYRYWFSKHLESLLARMR